MADFIYQEPFPVGEDKTKYRLLTKEYVKVVECDGRKILKVDPKGLELLSKEAYADVSFYLRAAHLQKLRNILEDPEATDNDKFVAYTMLLNQTVSAEGELPTCQDTGTAICIGHKGEDVWTGADDAECIARGVYETYKDRNLRYSQVVPFTMTDEKNSGTNLPAQIDIYGGKPGMEYEFLFITKGGGSANKTFLYQQTKALLNEESLTKFIQQHIFDLGTSACPPYHLAICIGGTSAEMCLSTVKKASAGYLDELPTSGNEGGRCFRDLEWEEKVLKICRESGVGAQFGGKYLVHDVRVIRAPRHAASCPVAIGVSCSADRNIKAKITPEGIFLEELEKNPARFLPAEAPSMSPAVDIDLDEGMDKVRAILTKYPIKTRLNLRGTLIVARDIAHARIKQMLDEGKPMPEYFKKHPVYYAGPAKTPQGMASGSFGPTTAGRMDPYVDLFQSQGGSLVMVAKGNRSQQVTDACRKHGGFYLGSIGGPAAILAKNSIKSVEVVDFPELGMEAVRKIYVENFPAFIIVDDKEWEEKVLKICRESGVGAQFGGKYLVHDVRVIRAPRHAASCPVAIGVSCSADRNIKAKITPEGIFLEELEKNPARFLPAEAPSMSPAVDIDLDEGMDKVRAILTKYPIKTRLNLRGTLIVARDIAHARIKQMLDEGKPMPEYFKKHPVYYAGPAKTPQGMASGSFGPTTAGRMDPYVDLFQSQGGSLVMVAKGNRSQQVTDACRKHGGFYLGSIGGPAAILAKNSIKSVEVVDFPELGMEAVRKIYVENFPAFIIVDDKGNDFFADFKH